MTSFQGLREQIFANFLHSGIGSSWTKDQLEIITSKDEDNHYSAWVVKNTAFGSPLLLGPDRPSCDNIEAAMNNLLEESAAMLGREMRSRLQADGHYIREVDQCRLRQDMPRRNFR